jgi:polyvinyl alcohol dehydrogenase (cytochrome)
VTNLIISRSILAVTLLLVVTSGTLSYPDDGTGQTQWSAAGQDLNNSRSQPAEHTIGPTNASTLGLKWTFATGGDVSATPTVSADAVFFPDWVGNLFAVRKDDGSLIWSHKVADYDGFPGAMSRVSPALHDNDLIIGDLESPGSPHNGANVIAVDQATGALRWITQVDQHPAAIITGSPVVFNYVVYVGVSSTEEGLAVDSSYPCCSFRGSLVALNANTGAVLWQTFSTPDNHGGTDGYSGGAIWQPPAIDPARGTL